MDWNNIASDERISLWKGFRKELENTDLQDRLEKTAKYWAGAPLGARSLDFYTPESWPDPWAILHHGSFCQNSISLLIYHTLLLSSDDGCNADIYLIDDGNDRYLIVVIDDKHVLNYVLGSVVDIDTIDIKILDTFADKVKQYV